MFEWQAVLKVLHPEDGAVVQALVSQVAEQVNTNIQNIQRHTFKLLVLGLGYVIHLERLEARR